MYLTIAEDSANCAAVRGNYYYAFGTNVTALVSLSSDRLKRPQCIFNYISEQILNCPN